MTQPGLPGLGPAGLYVYAILAEVPASLPPTEGLDGGRLSCVRHRRLAAATSWVQRALRPTPEDCLRHEEVVETLMGLAPLLPVRFGTVFAGEGDLRWSLRQRYGALCRDLRRLAGTVEFTVRALWEPEEAWLAAQAVARRPKPGQLLCDLPLARPGACYLMERRQHYLLERCQEEAARLVAWRLEEHLGPLAIGRRVATRQTPRLAASVSYLVRLSAVPEFRDGFAVLSARGSGSPPVRLVLSGPWPPYSFVSTPPEGPPASLGVRIMSNGSLALSG